MAPKVRPFPPRALAAVLFLLLPTLPFPSYPQQAQQNKPAAEKDSSVEAKARLLQDLDRQIDERRRELVREEESLSALKRALDTARQELLQERNRMEGLKREVETLLAEKGKVADERLDKVAKVYAAMKPKEAAAALERMDDPSALAILERLPGKTVGKFFDVMNKARVRELTRRLQEGRSGLPGK